MVNEKIDALTDESKPLPSPPPTPTPTPGLQSRPASKRWNEGGPKTEDCGVTKSSSDAILAEKKRLAARSEQARTPVKEATEKSNDNDIVKEKKRLSRRSGGKLTRTTNNEAEVRESNESSSFLLQKMALKTRRIGGRGTETKPASTRRAYPENDANSDKGQGKCIGLDDEATGGVRGRTHSVGEELMDTTANSMQSVLDKTTTRFEKMRGFNAIDTDQSSRSIPQQQHQQPGVVRVRGDGHHSDEEDRGKYDNLNDEFSNEFRRASIVQARIVSDDALEQEVLERVQQRGAFTLQEFPTNKSKRRQTNRWVCIGVPVCIVIIMALIGGLVGGVLSTRQSDSESQSPSSLPSPPLKSPAALLSSSTSLFPTTVPTTSVPNELLELYSIVQIQPDYPFPYDTSSYSYRALEWAQNQREKYPNLTRREVIYKYAGACMIFAVETFEFYGPEALASTRWLSDRPICDWLGVTCDYEDTSMTNSTANQAVVAFELTFPDTEGFIPRELALLSDSLVELTFYETQLYGTIPTELGLLTKLENLTLYSNDFTGEIPSEIGLLTRLKSLDVSFNFITGTLPTEILNIGSSLQVLNFDGNRLSAELNHDFFGSLTNLQAFRGDKNDFEGSLTSEIGLLTNLRKLSIFNNKMGSSLPTEIGLLTDLEELNIGLNEHTGSLPSEMGRLTSLQRLYLDRNNFIGTVPPQMFDQSFNLTLLALNVNELSGTLPEALGFLLNLKEVYVGGNTFVGSNPMCQSEVNDTAAASSSDDAIIMADCSELECPCCTYCCEDLLFCLREEILDP